MRKLAAEKAALTSELESCQRQVAELRAAVGVLAGASALAQGSIAWGQQLAQGQLAALPLVAPPMPLLGLAAGGVRLRGASELHHGGHATLLVELTNTGGLAARETLTTRSPDPEALARYLDQENLHPSFAMGFLR